jgi:nucleoside-diphosphate-sugar epimerase
LLHSLPCRDALIIAVGTRPALDPLGPYTVDFEGTVNLITAAKAAGVKKVGM